MKIKKVLTISSILLYFILVVSLVYYVAVRATDRYVTSATFSITQDQKSQSISAIELLGLNTSMGSADTELSVQYIQSADLLMGIDKELDLAGHYSDMNNDWFYRLEQDATFEEKLEFYRERIHAKLNDSGIVEVTVDSYDRNYSRVVCDVVLKKAEKYINEMNYKIANERLKLVIKEMETSDLALIEARKRYLAVQRKFETPDPEQDVLSMYSYLNLLKGKMTDTQAKIITLKESSPQALEIRDLETTLQFLRKTHRETYAELTGPDKDETTKLMADLKDAEYNIERALKHYDSTQLLYNQARIESIAKSRFFSRIQEPFTPEESIHPRRTYLGWSIFALSILIFIILKVLLQSIFSH